MHLIVTAADNATLAAKRSNIKIPAVMLSVTDPVGQGIVASLARPGQLQRQQLELATPSLKVSLRQFVARQVSDFATAFEAMRQDRSDVLFLTASSLNFVNRRRIVELAAQSRLPIKSDRKECTEAGGLMSYGYSRTASFHRAAIYVGKILNGAKPGDLPVEQPTKYELVINLNAEKVLGLTVPPSLIARADQIIE